ncbi:alpha/beta hydrolase family protein [Xylophilus ampelinus]|uniref:Secretory lipase n=1 Tax=Xylophilus ampelinus TaxID=54067 RepID=A0A318SYX4_9BURK|nr:lipase family protein [Xylophilus ampelinus]MCS4510069.1 lipase family protein [Xylophilus ampelinus]PYE78214.1 secretory lipase [Xylophilus ampelinus]
MTLLKSRLTLRIIFIIGMAGAISPLAASAAPPRGTVLNSNVLTRYTREAIHSLLVSAQSDDSAVCDVRVAEFKYATVGVDGEPATASAALLVPGGTNCRGPFPLVAYDAGTETLRSAEHAKAIRDNKGDDLRLTHLAAQGYVVVSTDYLGIGQSDYAFHPYLHADSEASATIDALRGARQVLQRLDTPLSGKVMLTGFSQGGHAAMATQREIEAHLSDEFNLVASAPISGPYALSQTFRDSWTGRNAVGENAFGIVLASYAVVGMQHTYRNLYLDPWQVFQDPWAKKVVSLFPGAYSTDELFLSDILPGIDQIGQYFQPDFYADFANDPQAPFLRDLERNDLLAWAPRTPTLLCGSDNDATVPLKNATMAIESFKHHGSNQVSMLDIGSGNPKDNGALAHLFTDELCLVAVRKQLLDKYR